MPMFHKKMLSSSSSMWKEGMPFLGSVKSLNCRWRMAAADLELISGDFAWGCVGMLGQMNLY